jgi:2-oxo-4-hydroxy-4-carboxy-5-ureidoimidazoline decarboxylase
MRLEDLNALAGESAARELLRCCDSARWARLMAVARPFPSADAMAVAADAIWWSLEPADWLEAFAAHPRIGETGGGRGATREVGEWSASEQAGVAEAAEEPRRRLAAANRDYEARFGYIFVVCATGKTAGAMLDLLDRRLRNDPHEELLVAAEEQRKITRLRLAKLLQVDAS